MWKHFYGTLKNFPQKLAMTVTLKTTNFKNFAIQGVSEKSIMKHLDELFGTANILVVAFRFFWKY